MMETFKRICIKEETIRDTKGSSMTVERGREYLTSKEENGKVGTSDLAESTAEKES